MTESTKTITPVWQQATKTSERMTFPQTTVKVKALEKEDLIGLLNSGERQAGIVLSLVNSGLTDAFANKAILRAASADLMRKEGETTETFRKRTYDLAKAKWDTLASDFLLDLSYEVEQQVLEDEAAVKVEPPTPRATKKIVLAQESYDKARSYFERWDTLNGVQASKVLTALSLDTVDPNAHQADALDAFERKYTRALDLPLDI